MPHLWFAARVTRKAGQTGGLPCTSCKAAEVWEVDALITEVRNNGGNTNWHTARYALKCPKRCRSPMISLEAPPFGKQRVRQQAYRYALINLALTILREAEARPTQQAVGTIEVWLALHVIRPFMKDQPLLNEFWRAATIEHRHSWTKPRRRRRIPSSRLARRTGSRCGRSRYRSFPGAGRRGGSAGSSSAHRGASRP